MERNTNTTKTQNKTDKSRVDIVLFCRYENKPVVGKKCPVDSRFAFRYGEKYLLCK